MVEVARRVVKRRTKRDNIVGYSSSYPRRQWAELVLTLLRSRGGVEGTSRAGNVVVGGGREVTEVGPKRGGEVVPTRVRPSTGDPVGGGRQSPKPGRVPREEYLGARSEPRVL